jgi:hypothetical protein
VTPEAVSKLVSLLASRLRVVIPAQFFVQVTEEGLLFTSDYSYAAPASARWLYRPLALSEGIAWRFEGNENVREYDLESVVNSAWFALSRIQDFISEATTDPWPGSASQPGLPYAEVRDDALHFGYGDPASPVLACEPIPLTELL